METLYFGNCTLISLDKRFGLRQTFGLSALEQCLTAQSELSAYQRESCDHLQNLLRLNNSGWNEQELSLHFIGPMFSLAEISSQQYNTFANRQAMLVGQYLNGDDRPVYGSYVIGQNWYFMALQGKQYSVSPAYSASSDDSVEIMRILLALKAIVEQYVLQSPGTFAQSIPVA